MMRRVRVWKSSISTIQVGCGYLYYTKATRFEASGYRCEFQHSMAYSIDCQSLGRGRSSSLVWLVAIGCLNVEGSAGDMVPRVSERRLGYNLTRYQLHL
jgi:hypothetical protein